jgi:diguanylate cyclase (GGDEF)-like protein/PAS domain S-box-containing protein
MIADEKQPGRPESAAQLAQRRELEAALERERTLLRTMIDLIPAQLYAKDAQSRFIACNVLVARGMGTTTAELIGKTDFDFFPREMAQGFCDDEQAIIRTGKPMLDREELALNQPSGTVRHISTSKIPLHDNAGNVVGIVGIGRDITERKLADERIRFLATHDGLTELPNRTSFSEQLNALIATADKDTRFAVLFVDLDHFKLINDTLGHEVGDALLKQTAARLRDSVRPRDVVARLGGDEFVVLCMDATELEDIDAVASKIVQALTRGKSLSLTVIAEGVETRRQAAFLRDQACDAMSGFYVNEPAAAADFSRLLRHQAELHAHNEGHEQP